MCDAKRYETESNADVLKGGVHKNCALSIVNVSDGKPEIERENVVYYDDAVEEW